MTCNEAGALGAAKRKQIEREPILDKARMMRAGFGLPPHIGLTPELILTKGDAL